jgi:hypothetical protein
MLNLKKSSNSALHTAKKNKNKFFLPQMLFIFNYFFELPANTITFLSKLLLIYNGDCQLWLK